MVAPEQAQAVAGLLMALVRNLVAVDDDLAEELPVAQLRVCGELYLAPRAMSALSQELGVSLSAMTQIADRLERAGLVRRVAEQSDRRVKQLRLTAQGRQTMRRREELRARRVATALDGMPPEARGRVQAALQELVTAAVATSAQRASQPADAATATGE
jgi:DNA-binding MarR family transcriptional regulator